MNLEVLKSILFRSDALYRDFITLKDWKKYVQTYEPNDLGLTVSALLDLFEKKEREWCEEQARLGTYNSWSESQQIWYEKSAVNRKNAWFSLLELKKDSPSAPIEWLVNLIIF